MNFWQKRSRKKFLAEIRSRRHAEDDLLTPAQRRDFDSVIADTAAAEDEAALKQLRSRYAALELPQKRGAFYAFLDLILVVGAVAFGLRGLYFQPFRIPTSSMQPTLYGIHFLTKDKPSNPFLTEVPPLLRGALFSAVRAHAVTETAGTLDYGKEELRQGVIFNRTGFSIGGRRYELPGNVKQVLSYAKLDPFREFSAGETIADGFVTLGDHLFVERFSLYLSPPKRGDVMVFCTEGLTVDQVPLSQNSGYYYIKRIAALPGDTVKLTGDQLYVRPRGETGFRKIQEIAPPFQKLYSMRGGYHGHLSNMGRQPFAFGLETTIPADHYLMLGDNSRFSLDSRFFGPVHRDQLIGRAWIIFYPLSRRTGRVDHCEPLDAPTGEAVGESFPVMYRQ